MKGKKKKILTAALICLISLAVSGAAAYGIRKSLTGSRVMVVSVEEMQEYGYDYGAEGETMEGEIFSGASQSIYLSPSMTVKEVKVKEGHFMLLLC